MATTVNRKVRKRFGVAFTNFADAFAAGGRSEFKDLTLYEIAPKEPGPSLYAWATSKQQAGLAAIAQLFDIGKISGGDLLCLARDAVVAARDASGDSPKDVEQD